MNWALKNIAGHGKGEIGKNAAFSAETTFARSGLTGMQWTDMMARTQNQLIQLKRREIYGAEQVSE